MMRWKHREHGFHHERDESMMRAAGWVLDYEPYPDEEPATVESFTMDAPAVESESAKRKGPGRPKKG